MKVRGVFAHIAVIVAAFAVIAAAILFCSVGVASASGDTFEVIFPTLSYFQSQDPTLIAANDLYLAVYDADAKALFVRDNHDTATYSYTLELDGVSKLLTVGSHAFIVASERYYTLDLTDRSAAVDEKTLATPQNITGLTSDGTYLYAKSTGGYLSIYNENMEIAPEFGREDQYNREYLPGYAALAAEDGMLYLLATDDKNAPKMYIYDCKSDSATTVEGYNYYVQSAYIGDVIYAQISDNEEIVNHGQLAVLDKTTGEMLFVSDIPLTSFCAYDKHLYVTYEGSVIVYSLTEQMDELYEDYTISMSGGDLSHLNCPSDIIRMGSVMLVADSNNKRVACLDSGLEMTPVAFSSSPIRLATDGSEAFALCEDGSIHRIGVDFSSTQVVESGDIVDIAYGDSLYAISADGLYTMLAGKLVLQARLSGAKRIATSASGKNAYVLTDNAILIYDSEGTLITTLPYDLTGAKDIAVDYEGNIFVAYANRIDKYANSFESLQAVNSVQLVNATARAALTSLCLDGATAYFTAEECLIGKLTLDAVTKENYTGGKADIAEDTPYVFAKLKDGARSYVTDADGRPDSLQAATDETILMFDVTTPFAGMKYALRADKLLLVKAADYDVLSVGALPTEQDGIGYAYSVNAGATLYLVPYLTDGVTVSQKTAFEAAFGTLGYDNDRWTLVRLDGKDYFVEADSVVTSSSVPTSPDQKIVDGRANADRVGGLVSLYGDAKLTNELRQLVDGTKLNVLEEYEDCYLVSVGDIVGYMRKDDVVIGGLTTSQIVSIVLAIVVLLTGTGIFIAIYLTRKHIEDSNAKG